MPETEPAGLKWESEVAERRMSERHRLALAGKAARNKRAQWIRPLAEELRKEVGRWHYRRRLAGPPDIEVAWIIHSHIAWKGAEASPETLWIDLPETDPARVLEAEKEGPDTSSPMPQETLLLLKHVLEELEEFGHRISSERFSENWKPGARGSTKGRTSVKKPKWGYSKKTPLAGKALCKSSLLSDFFELKK